MKPLTKETVGLGNVGKADPFREIREKEILEFWNSNAQYAELEKSGQKSMTSEKSRYEYAIRSLRKFKKLDGYQLFENDIVIHTSKGRIIAERRHGKD